MKFEWVVQEKISTRWYVHHQGLSEKDAREEFKRVTHKYTGRSYRLCRRIMDPEWEVVEGWT